MPQRTPYRVTVAWEVMVLRYRDGAEAQLDMEVVARILDRYGVIGDGADEFLHADPADPDVLWTRMFVAAPWVIHFDRPTVGSVWNLIFDLMQECGAVLSDPMSLMVLPSEEMRTALPPNATFRAVRVASSVEELLASLG